MGLRPTETNEGASDPCRGIHKFDRAFNRVPMGLWPTKKNGGAYGWCRGINNLDRAFNGAVAATPPEQGGLVSTAARRGLRITLEELADCGPLPDGRGSVSGAGSVSGESRYRGFPASKEAPALAPG